MKTPEEYETERQEILKRVPEEFRGVLGWMAYDRGHSSGYDEVLMILDSLVSDLEKPIKDFENRIHNLYRL